MNEELKFKVGDVWKMLAGDHTDIKRGETFSVLEVDQEGYALTQTGSKEVYVYKERIKSGSVVLVERKGMTTNNTTQTNEDLSYDFKRTRC